jgi:amino acid transporter
VDRNGVPWFSVIAAFVLGLVFLLPFPSWTALVELITDASLFMYAGAPLAMGAFRMRLPHADRPYRMPGATVLGPAAFIIANLIIYWGGFLTIWKLGIVMVVGYVIIAIFMAFDSQRPKLEWKSALWLPVYLIGLGIISWLGAYSGGAVKPPLNTNTISFGWDFAVVAVFSLAIYYWAQYTSLSTEEIEANVQSQIEAHVADTAAG